MYLDDDGIRLNIKLDMPADRSRRVPVVVIIHGFTGHMEEPHIVAVSEAVRRAGCASLRAEMYGHGGSGGDFSKHTLYKWLTNALTVIDYARSLGCASDVILCGHSQGGLTAMLAAAMKRDVIKALIPLSPATMIPEGARAGTLLGVGFDPDRVPDVLHSWDGRELDGNYVRVAQTIDVDAAIDSYGGPVLLIHGGEDETVPLACSEHACARYKNARLIVIPGDTHCYDHRVDMVAGAVETWLEELYS